MSPLKRRCSTSPDFINNEAKPKTARPEKKLKLMTTVEKQHRDPASNRRRRLAQLLQKQKQMSAAPGKKSTGFSATAKYHPANGLSKSAVSVPQAGSRFLSPPAGPESKLFTHQAPKFTILHRASEH